MSYTIIAVGGSGKQLATVVEWLSTLGLVEPPARILVSDPDQREVMSALRQASRSVPDASLRPVPDASGTTADHVTLQSAFADARPHDRLSHDLLPLLFDEDLREARIDEQFYGNPAAAATAFSRCADEKFDATLGRCMSSGDVVVVGSLFGGTGSGVFPRLLARLSQIRNPKSNYHLSFIALTQWFDLEEFNKTESDAEIPTPEKLRSNWKMGAKYLLQDFLHSNDKVDIGWILGPKGPDDASFPMPTRLKGMNITPSPLLLFAAWLFSVGYARGRGAFSQDRNEELWKQADAAIRHRIFALTVDGDEETCGIKNLLYYSDTNGTALSWDKFLALVRARAAMVDFIYNSFKPKGFLDQYRVECRGTMQLVGAQMVRLWRSLSKKGGQGAVTLRKAVTERCIKEAARQNRAGQLLQFEDFLVEVHRQFPSLSPALRSAGYPGLQVLTSGLPAQAALFRRCFSDLPADAVLALRTKNNAEPLVNHFFDKLSVLLLQVAPDQVPTIDSSKAMAWSASTGTSAFLLPGTQPGAGAPRPFSSSLLNAPLATRGVKKLGWDAWSGLKSPKPYSLPTPLSHALAFAHRIKYYLDAAAKGPASLREVPEEVCRDWRALKSLWLRLLGGELTLRNARVSGIDDVQSLAGIVGRYEKGRAFGGDLSTTAEGVRYPGGWLSFVSERSDDKRKTRDIGFFFPSVGPVPAPGWLVNEQAWDESHWALLKRNVEHLKEHYSVLGNQEELLWGRVLSRILLERPSGPDGAARTGFAEIPDGDVSFMPQLWLDSSESGQPMPVFLLARVPGFGQHLGRMLSAMESKDDAWDVIRGEDNTLVVKAGADVVGIVHGLGSASGPGVVELGKTEALSELPVAEGTAKDRMTAFLENKGWGNFHFAGLKTTDGVPLCAVWDWLSSGPGVIGGETIEDYLLHYQPMPRTKRFVAMRGNTPVSLSLKGLFRAQGKWYLVAPPVGSRPETRTATFMSSDGTPPEHRRVAVAADGTVTFGGKTKKWAPMEQTGGTVLNCGDSPRTCCCNGRTDEPWVFQNAVVVTDADDESDKILPPSTPVLPGYVHILQGDTSPESKGGTSGLRFSVVFADGFERTLNYAEKEVSTAPFNYVSWFPREFRTSDHCYPTTRFYFDPSSSDFEADIRVLLSKGANKQEWASVPARTLAEVGNQRVLCLALDDGHGRGGVYAVHWATPQKRGLGGEHQKIRLKVAVDLGTHTTKLQFWDGSAPAAINIAKGWAHPIGGAGRKDAMQDRLGRLPEYGQKDGRVFTGLITAGGVAVNGGNEEPRQVMLSTIPGVGFVSRGRGDSYEFAGNFKWKGGKFNDTDGEAAREHLKVYIETLLLQVDAALGCPDHMTVYFSYPGAFETRWATTYADIWAEAVRNFNRRFREGNVASLCTSETSGALPPDEANAALFSSGLWGKDGLVITADLGGGTLDVAGARVSRERNVLRIADFQRDSWRFGGRFLESKVFAAHASQTSEELVKKVDVELASFMLYVNSWAGNGLNDAEARDHILGDTKMQVEILGYLTSCTEAISRFVAGYVLSVNGEAKTKITVQLALNGLGWLLANVLELASGALALDAAGKGLGTEGGYSLEKRLVHFIETRVNELTGRSSGIHIEPVRISKEERAAGVATGLLQWASLDVPVAAQPGVKAANGFVDAYDNLPHRTIDWRDIVGNQGVPVTANTLVFHYEPAIPRTIDGHGIPPESAHDPKNTNARWGHLYQRTATRLIDEKGKTYYPELGRGGNDTRKPRTAIADFLRTLADLWEPNV